ncbi:MAG: HNH endonuclease [Bacillota bacterium]|nr:HNH endonuclease [Bacillota bacterium]
MEFKDFFSTLKKRISDGYDVPEFFHDLFAMITDVTEEEWGTPLDPATKKAKESSLRSYAKRTIPQKFAQKIVYRLSKENFIESLNSRPTDALELLADDFLAYDAETNKDNVAEKTADWFVEIIQNAAGFVPKSAMEQSKQQLAAADLKAKYGLYLLSEVGHNCPFPGCGRLLTKTNDGKTVDSYEVSLIDKKKAPEIQNLLALCPQCYATYFLDDTPKSCKELQEVKRLLVTHNGSVALLDNLPLEKGMVGVIKKVVKLKESDLVNASLDPKEIKQKLNPADNIALYTQVNMYVTTYFVRIREIMMSLDKRGDIEYDEIQDQMRAIYKRLKKAKKANMEIFNEIVDKIHRVSLQEDIYCQIIVSYFIQSCEVFDAITK